MSMDKPWNDVADQLRPVDPDLESPEDELTATGDAAPGDAEPIDVLEADPADVADQHRAVPLSEDQVAPEPDDRPRP